MTMSDFDYILLAALVLLALTSGALAMVVRKPRDQGPDKLYKHVFIDLETLGVKPNAPILAIGIAVRGSRGSNYDTGHNSSSEWRIRPDDAKRYGVEDPSTVAWWREQSEEAQRRAFTDGVRFHLPVALDALTSFIKNLGPDVLVWGNSPSFDCAILRHAYEQTGKKCPWTYYQERDCRTIAWLGNHHGVPHVEFEGLPHAAIDDARHQAKYTMDILSKLRVKL
jgi:exodeoxyribonuclease VIII